MNQEEEVEKVELRSLIRGRLKAMSALELADGSVAICNRLREQPVWSQAQVVLAYVPMTQEPDIWPLVVEAIKSGRQVALLRHAHDGDNYVPCMVRDFDRDLCPGKFGIMEPAPHCPIADLMRLDFVLVPGIGFTFNGGRLGRGKGYYDRVLAGVPALKCGVAFDCQIVEEIPLAPHDVRLNCILTPTRWQMVQTNGRF
jgi:5-formyltetrahydrofolate cyclo-ligase